MLAELNRSLTQRTTHHNSTARPFDVAAPPPRLLLPVRRGSGGLVARGRKHFTDNVKELADSIERVGKCLPSRTHTTMPLFFPRVTPVCSVSLHPKIRCLKHSKATFGQVPVSA